ncbi:hypothetical protein [Porphyrobacter sp. CACIAM 03H1]|uniref:hypothetical protein n=1 Tax=Porphyrobacter sp. CACIAM 03H1 TaxID=2003315 RepID=UPI0012FE0CF9|nr:hypothetical protein [Porphyrobacter sp. CACIAM 03H1]
MTAKASKTKAAGQAGKDQLSVAAEPGKSAERCRADVALDPAAHGMAATRMFARGSFGDLDTTALFESHRDKVAKAAGCDLSHQKMMLAAQADALNSIFTEMARRAALNMGEYLGATETYMRLGLKAQSQCRATIEALERLSSGRVQTVKHVHVNEGGQAIVADQFHQHTGGSENGKSNEQPHATGTVGESPALLGADPQGNGVPIPSGERQSPMPHARGQGQRRAEGQP